MIKLCFISLFYSPEFQDYQTTEYYRVTVKVKAKLDYPADKIRYKFEEKYCAIIIAGNVAGCMNDVISLVRMST